MLSQYKQILKSRIFPTRSKKSRRSKPELSRLSLALELLEDRILLAPLFAKAFTPDTIGPGSTTSLVFTINNNVFNGASPGPVTDLAFTDTLPAGMTIADPASGSTTCGGGAILSAPDGGSTISFSNGQVAGGQSCTVSVNVTGTMTATNVSGVLTSSAGNSGTAAADLNVETDRPGFSKSFSPDTISNGATSTLTFTVNNSSNAFPETFLSFSDSLPAGVVIAPVPNTTTNCGTFPAGRIFTANPGSSDFSFSYSGTPMFPAVSGEGTCTVSVDVLATANGTFDNVSSNLELDDSRTVGFATDTLNVPLNFLNKAFTDDPASPGGTVDLEFTLQNPSRTFAATAIAFDDSLPAGLTFNQLTSNDCGGTLDTATPSLLSFSGGSLALEASCLIDVRLNVPLGVSAGAYGNTTTAITATIDGDGVTGNMASDTLFVTTAPIFTKEFTDDPVGAGGSATLEFTIRNVSSTSAATDIEFTDDLNTAILGLAANGLVSTSGFDPDPLVDPCGSGSELTVFDLNDSLPSPPNPNFPPDPTMLIFTGGVLAAAGMPGDSCTFSIVVDVPAGIPTGTYTNTTSSLIATVDSNTVSKNPISGDLLVIGAPTVRKEFTDDPVAPGGTATLEFVLTHDDFAPADATGIAFMDDLTTLSPMVAGLMATSVDTNMCTGATVDIVTDPTSIDVSGASLMPGESCSIVVALSVPAGVTPGRKTNTTSTVTATVGGVATEGNVAQDDLRIAGLTLIKDFTDDPVIPGGETTLRFTLDNTTGVADATSISFDDDLDAVLDGLVAVAPLPVTPCGGTLSGTDDLMFSGGSVNAGDSCSFDVTLSVPVTIPNPSAPPATIRSDGSYVNATSSLFATIGGTFSVLDPASDVLVVDSELLGFSKEFINDPVSAGGTTTLKFNLTNLSATETVTDIEFIDDLDAALSGLTATGASSNTCGGSAVGMPMAFPTGVFAYQGGMLGPGASCMIVLNLAVPASPANGVFTNTTSELDGKVGPLDVFGAAASDNLVVSSAPLEIAVGKVLVGDDPVLVRFSDLPDSPTFTNPIVVAGPAENTNPAPVTVRVESVSSTGFTLRLNSFPRQPGTGTIAPVPHGPEFVTFLVVEAGSHTLPSGAKIVASTAQLNDPGFQTMGPGAYQQTALIPQFEPVNFGSTFGSAPAVMATVASVNGPGAVVVTIKDVTPTGFDAKLREAEKPNQLGHPDETVNYVAWDFGEDGAGDPLDFEILSATTNQDFLTVNHSGPKPCVLSQINTFNGADTAFSRHAFVNDTSLEVKVQEEQSFDLEVVHNAEDIAVFAFDCAIPEFNVEVGEVLLTGDTPVTVTLTESFTNPVVVAGPAGFNDMAPVTVRVFNVTSTSFQIQLKSFPNQPGGMAPVPHGASEQVSYLVVEAGSHTLASGEQVVAGSRLLNDPGFQTKGPGMAQRNALNQQFQPTNFGNTFTSGAPGVMTTVASNNGPGAVVVTMKDLTTNGFNAKLREAERPNKLGHPLETVNFVAWEFGSGTTSGTTPLKWEVLGATTNEHFTTVNYVSPGPKPFVLSQINTFNGADTSSSRHMNVTATSVDLKVEEEQSFDAEVVHNPEQFAVFAFDFNVAPILANIETAPLAYIENDAPKVITAGITVSDPDDANLESALIQITGNYQMGQDILGDNGSVPAGITVGPFNATFGTIALSGTASLADYQTALRAITYRNNSDNPSTLTRTVSFTINDGNVDSNGAMRNITVTPGNDAPTATNLTQTKTYTEGDASVALDDIVVSDIDTSPAQTITATLTLANTATGVLTTSGTATYTMGTGVWTITGTLVQVNAALAAVSFTPNTNNDVDTTISTHIEDQDTAGPADGTITLDVTPVNDPPTITPPTFTGFGNLTLNVPDNAGDLLDGASDPEGTTVSVVAATLTSAAAAATGTTVDDNNVVVLANGSFTYDPVAGFTGNDTFVYQLQDSGLPLPAVTANITATITLNDLDLAGAGDDLIWFIDEDATASANLGTQSDPYKSLLQFNALNTGAATVNPDDGDFVFLDEDTNDNNGNGVGVYDSGITLRIDQSFIGDGSTSDLATIAGITLGSFNSLPAFSGNAPDVTKATGNGVSLGSGNTIRGIDIGNTPGGHAFSGGAVGSLTISEVSVSGTGGILEVNSGGDLTGVSFTSQASTSTAAASGDEGIDLTGISGTYTGGSPTISGSDGAGISISNSTADFSFTNAVIDGTGTNGIDILGTNTGNFTFGSGSSIGATTSPSGIGINIDGGGGTSNAELTYSGDITQDTASQAVVRVNNHADGSGAGITFQTGTLSATDGTGLLFDNADGTYDFNGAVTLNGGDAGIDILNASAGTFTFANTSITNPTGNGLNIDGSTAGVTFSGGSGISKNNAGASVNVNNHSTGAVNIGVNINATGGTGLQFNDADGTYNFNTMTGTTTLNGGNAGIDILGGSAGTFTFGNTTIADPTGVAFNMSGNTGNVNYNGGSITKTNNANSAVAITGQTGGSVDINVGVTATTSTATGIALTTNSGGTINFDGGLNINTTSGTGFLAAGGGTVNVTGTNTIGATAALSKTAVNISDVTIGASGVTFQSISVDAGTAGSDTTGIILDDTGSGTFTVTGTGATGGSGGTIENFTNVDAITFNNTGGLITLKNMIIEDIADSNDGTDGIGTRSGVNGIQGTSVNGGLTLDNVTMRRFSDNAILGASGDGGNPTTNSTVWNGLQILNSTLEDSNRYHLDQGAAGPSDDLADDNNEGLVRIIGLSGTVLVDNSTLQRGATLLDFFTATSGTLDMTVQRSFFIDTLKEFKQTGTRNVGKSGIFLEARGSLNAVVKIGDHLSADTAVGNTASDNGNTFTDNGTASIRLLQQASASGSVKTAISQNTFVVLDHLTGPDGSPGGSLLFDHPQGGVLLNTGGGTYDAIVSNNLFDQVMKAGGLEGQLSIISDGGAAQFIVQGNEFKLPWDAGVLIRADGATSTKVLFGGTTAGQENTYTDGLVGGPSDDVGFATQSPFNPFLVNVRNGGNLDLTIQNEILHQHDDVSSGFSNSFHASINSSGGTLNLYLDDSKSPDGYGLEHNGGTFLLFREDMADTTAATIIDGNGNTGGSNNDNTDPPTVSTTGTITASDIAPQLPSITIP